MKSKEVLALDGVFVLLSAVNFMGYCHNQKKQKKLDHCLFFILFF